jgi:hypothetical protein
VRPETEQQKSSLTTQLELSSDRTQFCEAGDAHYKLTVLFFFLLLACLAAAACSCPWSRIFERETKCGQDYSSRQVRKRKFANR